MTDRTAIQNHIRTNQVYSDRPIQPKPQKESVAEFLARGGEIKKVPTGALGFEFATSPKHIAERYKKRAQSRKSK